LKQLGGEGSIGHALEFVTGVGLGAEVCKEGSANKIKGLVRRLGKPLTNF
jgi:hypothetical protein